MLGFDNQEIIDTEGRVELEDARQNPFTGFYGYILAYNTARDTPQTKAERGVNPNYQIHTGIDYPDARASEGGQRIMSESRFYEDPDNVMQIYAPGAMDEQVKHNLGEMVRQAAADYSTNMRVPQNDAPDNTNIIKRGF